MATLKTLATETYYYKGFEIKRIDTIESGFSTLSGYPQRSWYIDGKEAFTVDHNGETKLACYLDKTAYHGGNRTIFAYFDPFCDYYTIDNSIVEPVMNELDKYILHDFVQTEF